MDLALRHEHQFHVLHVSTAEEVEMLRARSRWLSAEVCPHHLFFNVDDYERLGSLIKMNPSVKTAADNVALWAGLLDGTIEVIATDHAPHTLEEKALPYPGAPSGLPAVENSLALMLNQTARGKCTLEQVVRWMCTAPAQVWHMQNKGNIIEGYDADLVLVNLNLTQQIQNERQETKCRWSPWHGENLTGWPVRTWVRGREVYRWEDGRAKFNDAVRGDEIHFLADRTGGLTR
jgi:dihydroorotase